MLQTLVIWLERSSHPHWPKGKRAFSTRDQGSCHRWDRGLPGEGLAVPTHSYNDHCDQSPACRLDPCPQRRGVLEQGSQVMGQGFHTRSPPMPHTHLQPLLIKVWPHGPRPVQSPSGSLTKAAVGLAGDKATSHHGRPWCQCQVLGNP